MSPVHIAVGESGLVVSITRGTKYVHSTRIYLFPYEYVFGVVALLAVIIWLIVRSRKTTK